MLPRCIANALVLTNTIRFNATNLPIKQTAFTVSQYDRPNALRRYGEIALFLGFTETHTVDRASMPCWSGWMNSRPIWVFPCRSKNLAIKAFDDECTGANPRYPLISELRDILVDSYYGRPYVESYERVAIPHGYQSENEHEMTAPAESAES